MQKFWQLLLIMCCGTAIVLIGFPSAYAQEAKAEFTLDEIVVTAERRETSAQDTPVAVSAWDSNALDEQIMTGTQDLQMRMPSTYVSGAGEVTIRGVGDTGGAYLGTDPGVGIFKDGFFNSEGGSYLSDLFDVERIENVRGPQSTLYGRATIGGAINIITKKPTKEWSGQVKTTIGNYEKRDFHAAFGGPTGLMNNLYYRVRLSDIYDAGYEKNILYDDYQGGHDRWYVDMKLLYEPMDNLDILVQYSIVDQKDEPNPTNIRDEWPMAGVEWPYPGVQWAQAQFPGSKYPNPFYYWPTDSANYPGLPTSNPGMQDPYKVAGNLIGINSLDKKEGSITATWDVGNFTLMYLGAYRDWDNHIVGSDGDTGPMPVSYASKTSRSDVASYEWSGELQVMYGADDVPYSVIGGLYYFDRHRQTFVYTRYYGEIFEDEDAENYLTTTFPLYLTQTVDSGPIHHPDNAVNIQAGDLWDISQAAYAQVDYTFLDKWTATLGLRYAEDKKKGDAWFYYQYTPSWVIVQAPPTNNAYEWCPYLFDGIDDPMVTSDSGVLQAPFPIDPSPKSNGKWSEWLYKVGLDYKPDDGTLIYGKYEHGFKPGGFALASSETRNFDAELVDAYEVGWKQLWMSDRFSTTISGYFYDYDGLQMNFWDPVNNTSYFTNATSADIHGIEADFTGYVIENLLASISYSWLSTEFGPYPGQVDSAHQRGTGDDPNPAGDTRRYPNPGAVWDPTHGRSGAWVENLEGKSMPYSPAHKLMINATYTIPTDIGDFSLHALYFWQDEVYTTSFNTPEQTAPAYDRVDGQIMWSSPGYAWRVIVWAKNLMDETDIIAQSTGTAPSGYPITATYIPPITFGIDISYKW